MKQLIHYLKKNNLLILLIFVLSYYSNAQTSSNNTPINIKIGDATILRVASKNKDNTFWVLNYIIVNKVVYSGDMFDGNNLSCFKNLNKNIIDSINSLLYNDNMNALNDTLNLIKYNWLGTKIPSLDSMFVFKCIYVPVKYIELPCSVSTPNYFSFLYTQNFNGLQILDVYLKKIKISKAPRYILKNIKKHRFCLEKLMESYKDFNDCLYKK